MKKFLIISLILNIIFLILYFRLQNQFDLKKSVYEQNIAALNDSIDSFKAKNGQLIYEKHAFLLEMRYLEEENKKLVKELKELKKRPLYVTNFVTKIVHDTVFIKPSTIFDDIIYDENGTKYVPYKWNHKKIYDEYNYRYLEGYFLIKLDTNKNISTEKFSIIRDEIGLSLSTGIIETENGKLKIFITSKYPGFKAVKIEGAVFDPRKSEVIKKFFPPKRWGLSLYGGYGMQISPTGQISPGFQIGAGLSYSLIQW